MKDARKKLLSHILMVVAPLLVLLMITVAWFVSSRTVGLSELSFAAQDSGPGAVLHRAKELKDRATGLDADGVPTLSHGITWGKEETVEHSDITVKNMLPGQCEYYLLVSKGKFKPRLLDVVITDADGKEVTTAAENTALLLTQCVGLYLLPTTIDLEKSPEDQTERSPAVITLDRTDGKLTDAVFRGDPQTVSLPKMEDKDAKTAYILAVYCDPQYGQNGPGAAGGKGSNGVHAGSLTGSVSFSLAFDAVEGS